MSQTTTRHATRVGVILLLTTFAAAAVTMDPVEAQLTVYKVEGVVYGPSFEPLKNAVVTLYTTSGAKAGTATTDAAGKYSIGSLNSGKYNLSAASSCCPAYWVPVDVAGSDPVVQQNVVLGKSQGQGNLLLRGIAKDESTGKPLANVRLEMWNHPQRTDEKGYPAPYYENRQSAVTGSDGSYSFNVEAGSVSISARAEGYDILHTNFMMETSRSVDLPMRSTSGDAVTIKGTIKGTDGKPVSGAWVNVQPTYECDGDVCSTTAYPAEPRGANTSGDVHYWYEPSNSPYAGASTDSQGKYTLTTAPGRLMLSAHAHDYLQNQTKFTANAGETKTVDLVLERVPADSVRVRGKVLDAETGKPVPHAQVHLENQRWGHWNSTMTKEDGTFDFYTKPGYTILTVSAEQHYWVPCSYEDRPTSDGIRASDAYYPCESGQRTRDRAYFGRVMSFVGTDQGQTLEVKMQPRPAPNAELKGYVVNATSQTALPGVQVHFYNEFTRDWGTATTDQDGSFRIKVHEGHYTIRAYREGYFDGVINAQVKDGESKRIDLELTPGEKRYGGGCCYAVADMAYASKGGSAGAPAPQMSVQRTGASEAGMAGGAGSESYKGEGGGLGPYKPLSEESKGTSPSLGVGVLAASLFALALLRRRSH